MATKKTIDVMADVAANPVTSYTESTKKPGPRKKEPKRAPDEELRVNLLTTKTKWADIKTLCHLKQTCPNDLVEGLLDKELAANAELLKQFKALAAKAQKEG